MNQFIDKSAFYYLADLIHKRKSIILWYTYIQLVNKMTV